MRRSALESIDRALRDPWLSRISNLWFVWGLLTFGYAFVVHAADLIGPGSVALLSGFALIFLVALGGALRRRFTQPRGDQTPPPSDPRQVIAASSPGSDLVVEIEEEVWVPWGERLYILEALVRVTNITGNRKQLHGFVFASNSSTAGALVSIDLRREVERRKGQHNALPRMLDAGESVTAWVVNVLNRPVEGGHGGYEVGTRDEMNNDYAVVRPGEPGRQRVWGAALADEQGGPTQKGPARALIADASLLGQEPALEQKATEQQEATQRDAESRCSIARELIARGEALQARLAQGKGLSSPPPIRQEIAVDPFSRTASDLHRRELRRTGS